MIAKLLRLAFAALLLTAAGAAPTPLLRDGEPVQWWFTFKLNAAAFPGCGGAERSCLFGGTAQPYKQWGQQFVYASSADPNLKQGGGCAGDSLADPIGATFNAIYNGAWNYLVWNDQFYSDPNVAKCGDACLAPWGHSKGILAWDDDGNGVVMQVTTPDWPGSGSAAHPRASEGNTLGCTARDNNVMVSQHAFALRLTKADVVAVLTGLHNASVVTAPAKLQIASNGGPAEIVALVQSLGERTKSKIWTKTVLSSGVVLISKPSALWVPPWQMVSSILGGVSLRTATWWAYPQIYSTTKAMTMACWDDSLPDKPGAVEIATSGQWNGTVFGLSGGLGANYNHAKIGVSTDGDRDYVIFGDLNQQGNAVDTDQKCSRSQNGRGGLFFVVSEPTLWHAVSDLVKGDTAPTQAPKSKPAP